MQYVTLKAGDIFLTKGDSFISKAIRFLTRDAGESRTQVNHVGIVMTDGPPRMVEIVEAASQVKRRRLSAYIGGNTKVAVYRPINVEEHDITAIMNRAQSYVGRKYGYLKIVAHFLDWCLGGRYLFRRITCMDNYPICSWVVAYAYDAADISFGVDPGAASPDDIWDWVTTPAIPGRFIEIHPLEVLK